MPTYEITELAPPREAEGADSACVGLALNEGGSVAGSASNPSFGEAIFWDTAKEPLVIEQDESPSMFGAPTQATGINDEDVSVGSIQDESITDVDGRFWPHAFVYSGGLTDLAPIVGGEGSIAYDINNQGLVVGTFFYVGPDGPRHKGFAYDSSSDSLTTIEGLPGHKTAYALAVNELGHTIGASAANTSSNFSLFITRRDGGPGEGAPEDLGGITWLGDINDHDVITGSRQFSGAWWVSAFRLDADAKDPSFEDLGPSLPARFFTSVGTGINNDGAVVGQASDNDGSHAMINVASGPEAGWHNLNDALVDGEGWHLTYATAINDAGQIVGFGQHHGRQRAFLLHPVERFNAADAKIASVLYELILIFGGGVVDAPGGFGITGGGNPVPIGPQEFARVWRRLSANERDAYTGMAIRNLGGIVADRESRADVERVATRLMMTGAQTRAGG